MEEDLSADPPVDGWYSEYEQPEPQPAPKPRMDRAEYARRIAQDFPLD